jgi:hypothetical protein
MRANTTFFRRLRVLALLGVFAISILAAGCGDDDGDDYTSPLAGLSANARPDILVDIGGEPIAGPPPVKTRFTSHASGADGPFLFHWSFDDGTTSTEQNPVHTFDKSGVYDVVLVVRNLEGKSSQRGALVGVWPQAEWASGTGKNVPLIGTKAVKERQVRQVARSKKRRAELAARLRAELRAEARAQGSGPS